MIIFEFQHFLEEKKNYTLPALLKILNSWGLIELRIKESTPHTK